MHVERFYPKRLHRHWSVADGALGALRLNGLGSPHSLWVFKADAEEMAYRLESLIPIERAYTPLTDGQKKPNI
jgi:hypothetical protein